MIWLYSPRPPQSLHRVLSLIWSVSCEHCSGRGWYCEPIEGTEYDYNERYCDCEAGRWRRVADGWSWDAMDEWYAELMGGER